MQPSKPMSQGLKSALDFGPLIIFFLTYFITKKIFGPTPEGELPAGMMWATSVFMAATLLSLAITFIIERKIHPMPATTGVVIFVFGGLTLLLHDEQFIKLKPTIVYSAFAAVLLFSYVSGKLFIRHLLGSALQLTDQGWRQMTFRWMLFFIFAAILNEVVRRNFSTDVWITFKVWGFAILTIAFGVWQVLAVSKYQIKQEE